MKIPRKNVATVIANHKCRDDSAAPRAADAGWVMGTAPLLPSDHPQSKEQLLTESVSPSANRGGNRQVPYVS